MTAAAHSLWAAPAPRVFTISPSEPFAARLAGALAASLPQPIEPLAWADALILLPTRRAAKDFAAALLAARPGNGGGVAAILPRLAALGDLEDESLETIALYGAAAPKGREIAPLARRLALAACLQREGVVDDFRRGLMLAGDLASVIDLAHQYGPVDWAALTPFLAERDFAEHWRTAGAALSLLNDAWPATLATHGWVEPQAAHAARARALAQAWETQPPNFPLIIAGSTGSQPATRALMRAAAFAPQGAVILPGLDLDLDEKAWAAIGPEHPQAALRATLAALGIERSAVRPLPGGRDDALARARRRLLNEALRPAELTDDWLRRLTDLGGADFVRTALAGLEIVSLPREDAEAELSALLMAKARADGKSVVLATPDSGLTRRVIAKLARLGLRPMASAGLTLAETPIGEALIALARLGADPSDPVLLDRALGASAIAAAVSGEDDGEGLAALRAIALAGVRKAPDWPGLIAYCRQAPHAPMTQKEAAADFAAALADKVAFLAPPHSAFAAHLRGLVGAMEAFLGPQAWSGPAGLAAADLLRPLVDAPGIEALLDSEAFADFLAQAFAATSLPITDGDPDCAILGPLEARLQARDLVILGGLNEGMWPKPARQDAFLNRAMRAHLGLPAPEERLGLAAHDFAQLASAPAIVVLRAERQGGEPAVKSRWLWRLEALARGAGADLAPSPELAEIIDIAARAHAPPTRLRIAPPAPRPPAKARPRRLRVTDIETLIRDPFAIYARLILGLPVREGPRPPDARDYGMAAHRLAERLAQGDTSIDDAAIAAAFRDYGHDPGAAHQHALRLSAALAAFATHYCGPGAQLFPEMRGQWRPFGLDLTIDGRADLIRLLADGGLDIVDFKTGTSPTVKQIASGLSPQLPIEALMALEGAFAGLPAFHAIAELTIYRLRARDFGPEQISGLKAKSLHLILDETRQSLARLLAHYLAPHSAFFSKPRVMLASLFGDYDHLARRAEWALDEGQE